MKKRSDDRVIGASGDLTALDEPFTMPTPESQRRLCAFIDASNHANSPDFKGLVLMSLIHYVDDDILAGAIDDALRTLSGDPGGNA